MNIIVLAAAGSDYGVDYENTKLLVNVNGVPLIQSIIEWVSEINRNASINVLVLREPSRRLCISNIATLANPQVHIHEIDVETKGALCSAMLVREQLVAGEPLLLLNANLVLDMPVSTITDFFSNGTAAAGVVTFDSLHPRWSFVKTRSDLSVTEVAEKKPISRAACVGIYWFRDSTEFFTYAEEVIVKRLSVHGKFYISLVLNEYILNRKLVLSMNLPGKSVTHIL